MIANEESLSECDLCDCLWRREFTDGKQRKRIHHILFHEPCSRCPSPDPALCQFCRHLRLYHHIFCSPASDSEIQSFLDFELTTAAKSDLTRITSCRSCQFLEKVCTTRIQSLVQAGHKHDDIQISVYLTNAAHSDSSTATLAFNIDGDWQSGMDIKLMAHDLAVIGEAARHALLSNTLRVQSFVDWSRVSFWIRRCTASHADCGLDTRYQPTADFRVIDTHSRCLQVLSEPVKLVALSYVWGTHSNDARLKATRDNIDSLHKSGSLDMTSIAPAVNSAIIACQKLGYRYLWVDRLCIIQDDDVNRNHNLAAMKDIYSKATVVLMHCTGDSCDESMAGVDRPRQVFRSSVELQHLHLTTTLPDMSESALSSTWASRGWTYQESVLPRRRLLFTEQQVIFQCNSETIYEDNLLNDEPLYQVDTYARFAWRNKIIPLSREQQDSPFHEFSQHLACYSRRQLTYETDIFNAFQGIAGTLYPRPGVLHYGLPVDDFSQALLWRYDTGQPQTSGNTTAGSRQLLPSWSWASISGPICYSISSERWHGSLVNWWLAQLVDGKPIWVQVNATNTRSCTEWRDTTGVSSSPQLFMALAVVSGCFERSCPVTSMPRMPSWSDLPEQLSNFWKDYASFATRLLVSATMVLEGACQFLKAGMIRTEAQAAYLKIEPQLSGNHERRCWSDLFDSSGHYVGLLAPFSLRQTVLNSDRLLYIGVSIGGIDRKIMENYDSDEWAQEIASDTYKDREGQMLRCLPVVHVLCLAQQGEAYRRISVGWVLLTRWVQTERHWLEVIIE